jgi:hypothetical protein
LHRALYKEKLPLKPREVGPLLRRFYQKIDEMGQGEPQKSVEFDYYMAWQKEANSRASRITRGDVIAKAIRNEVE